MAIVSPVVRFLVPLRLAAGPLFRMDEPIEIWLWFFGNAITQTPRPDEVVITPSAGRGQHPEAPAE